jgi:5-methylcytosine-specific restriction endonuclease McrA
MWTNKKRKQKIPAAFREQIWMRDCGQKFQSKCLTRWCNNTITVFDFQSGHNIPESKGGQTVPSNLVPICSRCNLSMGNRYTFTEWNALTASTDAKAKAKPINEVPVKTSNWCCF